MVSLICGNPLNSSVMLFRLSLVLILLVVSSSCSRSLKTKTGVASPTPQTEPRSAVQKDWKRVEVADKFVVYMPSDMETSDELEADYYGAYANYENNEFLWGYQYASADLCAPVDWLLKDPTHRESELDIDGKRAKVDTWTSAKTGQYFVTACLSDIDGHGTRLHLSALSKKEQAINVAREIFASIQFRKGAT